MVCWPVLAETREVFLMYKIRYSPTLPPLLENVCELVETKPNVLVEEPIPNTAEPVPCECDLISSNSTHTLLLGGMWTQKKRVSLVES